MSAKKSVQNIVSAPATETPKTEKKPRTPKFNPTPNVVFVKPFMGTIELVVVKCDKEFKAIMMHDTSHQDCLDVTEAPEFQAMVKKGLKGKTAKQFIIGLFHNETDAILFAQVKAQYVPGDFVETEEPVKPE